MMLLLLLLLLLLRCKIHRGAGSQGEFGGYRADDHSFFVVGVFRVKWVVGVRVVVVRASRGGGGGLAGGLGEGSRV